MIKVFTDFPALLREKVGRGYTKTATGDQSAPNFVSPTITILSVEDRVYAIRYEHALQEVLGLGNKNPSLHSFAKYFH